MCQIWEINGNRNIFGYLDVLCSMTSWCRSCDWSWHHNLKPILQVRGEKTFVCAVCQFDVVCICLHMFAYVCMFAEKVWGVTNRKLNRKINSVQLCLNNDRSGRYFFNLLHAPARPAMTLSWHLLTLLHLVASCCQLLIPGVAGMTSAMALRQHLFRNISSSIRRTWAA